MFCVERSCRGWLLVQIDDAGAELRLLEGRAERSLEDRPEPGRRHKGSAKGRVARGKWSNGREAGSTAETPQIQKAQTQGSEAPGSAAYPQAPALDTEQAQLAKSRPQAVNRRSKSTKRDQAGRF